MDLSDERWRHQVLTNGPRGRWRTLPGSHTGLFDEAVQFRDDGSGELQTRSLMRGAEALRFTWRMAGHGVIECQPQYERPELGPDGQPETADWFRLPFVIERCATDAGSHWALKERSAAGFWELTAPLVPVEPGAP